MDYHSEVTALYQPALDALAAQGLDADLIDTGGSCKAIAIELDDAGTYCLLTSGGPLDDQRDPSLFWELGVGDEGQRFCVTLQMTDDPVNDQALASEVRGILDPYPAIKVRA